MMKTLFLSTSICRSLSLFVLLSAFVSARAQDTSQKVVIDSTVQKSKDLNAISSSTKLDSSKSTLIPFTKQYGVGLNGGTPGAGLDFYYKFHRHFGVRVGFNYLAYKLNDQQFSITNTATDGTKSIQKVQANLDFNMNNIAALVEYSVGQKGRVRFVTGIAYYPKKSAVADAKLISNAKFNDVEISGDDLGSGGGTLTFTSKISPYLGMSVGRLAPRKRVNFSADFGAYYLGNYDITNVVINPGLLLEGNKDNAPILARNLNADWRNKIFPVFNLRLGIRLNNNTEGGISAPN